MIELLYNLTVIYCSEVIVVINNIQSLIDNIVFSFVHLKPVSRKIYMNVGSIHPFASQHPQVSSGKMNEVKIEATPLACIEVGMLG